MAKNKKKKSPKKDKSFIGCTAANLHEAGRSEYLAHYVFSSFGTSVPVPRQEDTGLDLYCTLTERVGQRLWPIASYCVQVKSTSDPWEFADVRSIQWIVEHPLPVFLCVVNKKTATLSVYHTSPRFFIWTALPELKRLVMLPGAKGKGYGMPWEEEDYKDAKDGEFHLSAPIAEFSLTEILDDEFHGKIRNVLHNWIVLDQRNVFRIQAGVRQFETISHYLTNDPTIPGHSRTWRTELNDDEFKKGLLTFVEHAKWLSHHLASKNDKRGFLRLDLFLRHLGAMDAITDGFYGSHLYSNLRQRFEPDEAVRRKEYFAGLDGLSKKLDELTAESILEAEVAEKQEAENREALEKTRIAEAENAQGGSDVT
jgi:hypothetical protein